MANRLKGKTALITGAGRGIGKKVASLFAREGAALFLVGHVDQNALDQTLSEVRRLGVNAQGGLFDVSDYQQVKRLADMIESGLGGLDIVVNNAGIIKPTPLLEITPSQWERTIQTHLNGTFYCTLEMTKRFLAPKRAGKIINVTAPAALRGSIGVADYASAKGGIIAFTRNAARELAPLNIQVNAVLPIARSRMTDALADFRAAAIGEDTAWLRNLPTPEVTAPAFLFFACSDSDWVSGQVLAADGGATA